VKPSPPIMWYRVCHAGGASSSQPSCSSQKSHSSNSSSGTGISSSGSKGSASVGRGTRPKRRHMQFRFASWDWRC
jgi:hypothetical protein